MDAIKQSKELLATLETAQKQAMELREAMNDSDHLEVTYLGLATETVRLRLGFLENQSAAEIADGPAGAEKTEKKHKSRTRGAGE